MSTGGGGSSERARGEAQQTSAGKNVGGKGMKGRMGLPPAAGAAPRHTGRRPTIPTQRIRIASQLEAWSYFFFQRQSDTVGVGPGGSTLNMKWTVIEE